MKKIMCQQYVSVGVHSYPCRFRAKYKIVNLGIHDEDCESEGYTLYLCGTHYRGRGYNPNEKITLIKKETK